MGSHLPQRLVATRQWTSARPGQTLVLGALMMTSLIAMTGLTVDVGVWLVAKARLQRAVDAATLSVILDQPTPAQTGGASAVATVKSRTLILDQGIPDDQIVSVTTAVPRTNQFRVTAQQQVPTAFARIIGVNAATINAQATADINAYVEIPVSPVCGGAVAGSSVICDGGVGDSTMDHFGTSRIPAHGDPYTNPTSAWYLNADGTPALPEGYLYRVDVAPGYTGALEIQVFDPDTFNQDDPPRWLDPCPPAIVGDPCDSIANPTWSALTNHNHSSTNSVPAVGPHLFAPGYHLFWRVDECFGSNCQRETDMTALEFTLWYLSPDAHDPLYPIGNERQDIARVLYMDSRSSYTCQSTGASRPQLLDPGTPCTTRTWTCTAPYGLEANCTDLRWVNLFTIPNVGVYPARVDGSRSFFIYVRTPSATTTETGYHLRSGPPVGDADQNTDPDCDVPNAFTKGWDQREHVNGQASCPWINGRPGAYTKIYARRAMPTNAMQYGGTGSPPYIVWLGYIPKTAAGQTLRLRNFDLDRPTSPACPPGNSTTNLTYVAWFPTDGRRSNLLQGCGSLNGQWMEHLWTVPPATDTAFWGSDQGFWLYADVFQKTNVYDTVTWEVIFVRARLVG